MKAKPEYEFYTEDFLRAVRPEWLARWDAARALGEDIEPTPKPTHCAGCGTPVCVHSYIADADALITLYLQEAGHYTCLSLERQRKHRRLHNQIVQAILLMELYRHVEKPEHGCELYVGALDHFGTWRAAPARIEYDHAAGVRAIGRAAFAGRTQTHVELERELAILADGHTLEQRRGRVRPHLIELIHAHRMEHAYQRAVEVQSHGGSIEALWSPAWLRAPLSSLTLVDADGVVLEGRMKIAAMSEIQRLSWHGDGAMGEFSFIDPHKPQVTSDLATTGLTRAGLHVPHAGLMMSLRAAGEKTMAGCLTPGQTPAQRALLQFYPEEAMYG